MRSPRHLPHDWYPAPLPANVELGAGSWLYSSFAFLHCRSRRPQAVRVGRSSGIYNGSFFELGPDAEVSIGDYCTLVGAIITTNGGVRIGDYCFVAHEVVIADGPFATPMLAANCDASTPGSPVECVALGMDVWVGAGATLLRGANIGNGAIIGAAAVVDFAVPAYGIVGGNPAKILGYARGRGGAP
jgi:acetyltransferase-like isoleucine patch superfamily enzyme